MKIRYTDFKFSKKTLDVIEQADSVIQDYQGQDFV